MMNILDLSKSLELIKILLIEATRVIWIINESSWSGYMWVFYKSFHPA